MKNKLNYKTKQSEDLLSYLSVMQGAHVTVNDISDYFKEQGAPIGITTIYRHLERMVAAGVVNRYIFEQSAAACFEYIGEKENCERPICFHFKCEKCEKLIHLKCGQLEHIQTHLLEQHGFILDPLRTVLYGSCDECKTI